MKPRVVVLSGKVCSGKSTLATLLTVNADAELAKSKDLIFDVARPTARTREAARVAGRRLDKSTRGRWLAEALSRRVAAGDTAELIVVDSIRSPEQIYALRQLPFRLTHVHLHASASTLENRYASKAVAGESNTYQALTSNWAERHANALGKLADVVIDTDRCSASDVYARVIARLELRPLIAPPNVDIIVGGQYGSEGKGNIAHFLAPEYDVLVRVGGPNAGHQVFLGPGQAPYTFRQLPSGALGNPEAKLVIGAGAVIGLEVLLREIADLSLSYEKLLIDERAMIIDAADVAWETAHLKGAIGSTAQGIGRATARKILGRQVGSDVRLAKDIPALNKYIGDSVEFFGRCLSKGKRIMLEGTQGTSLSLHHGHYPHVTSRATTASGCLAEAGLAPRHVRKVLMVCRSYPIRVGDSIDGKTSGYMSQEIQFEDIADRSGIPLETLVKKEVGSVSGRKRRVAEFDWAQFRRSLLLNGATDIALTFSDYFSIRNRKAFRYEQLTEETLRFIEEMEKVGGVNVSIVSTDFSERNIIDRRMW